MKQYTFEVIINEDNDEFWESIENKDISGCDDILEIIKSYIDNTNLTSRVKLVEFSDK